MKAKKTEEIVDFIIVGSMKAGTTSLRHWLMKSENVSMLRSESHFFNHADRFSKGPKEYKKYLPSEKSGFLVGDDTPTYSYLPEVPERIYNMAPFVNILWILRDPLDRAISQFWHASRKGVEVRSINEAFAEELRGEPQNIWKRYLHRSCYREQVERYLRFFGREQMHFVNFHSFAANDESEKRDITNFLGLNQISAKVPHSNETSFYPRSSVNHLLFRAPMPSRTKRYIRRAFGHQKKQRPILSHALQAEARDFLNKENQGLEKLVGFSFLE